MIRNERDLRHDQALDIAQKMLVAARTAPKGKGADIVECAVVDGDDLERLAQEMERIGTERGHRFFLRDAGNVRQSLCTLLVGTREQAQALDCGHCGFPTCASRADGVPCAINSVDVGSRWAPHARRRATTAWTRACCSPPASPPRAWACSARTHGRSTPSR